jgi:hypothetical protein
VSGARASLPATVERLVDVVLLAAANDADVPDYETAVGHVYSDFMRGVGQQAGARARIAALGAADPLEEGWSAAAAHTGQVFGVELAYAALIIDGLSRLHAQATNRTPAQVLREVLAGVTPQEGHDG